MNDEPNRLGSVYRTRTVLIRIQSEIDTGISSSGNNENRNWIFWVFILHCPFRMLSCNRKILHGFRLYEGAARSYGSKYGASVRFYRGARNIQRQGIFDRHTYRFLDRGIRPLRANRIRRRVQQRIRPLFMGRNWLRCPCLSRKKGDGGESALGLPAQSGGVRLQRF